MNEKSEGGAGQDEQAPSGSRWTADFLASIVVFLVALPLCIGIAVACGVPPERGLVTGIVGGIIVGRLAGAPLLVSGPAASLIVPVSELLQTHGLWALAPVVVLAGVWQLLAGLLRLGQWFRAVAPAVIHGMLIGIGVLICASQAHVAIDGDPKASFVANVLALPVALWQGLTAGDGPSGAAPVLVALMTVALIVLWNQHKPQHLRLIPGHLVSLAVITLAVLVTGAPVKFLDVSSNFFEGLERIETDSLAILLDPSVLALSVVFAFVASAATLLTAAAIDQRQTHARTNYDREMVAQGIGNMITGAMGGLPMTGVIVRSSVNVDAGARTRLSTILHGTWILLFVAAAPELLERIPRASLGAILVYTGYRLLDYRALAELYRRGRAELAIALITLLGVVFVDLFVGILGGLAAALGKLVYTFAKLEVRNERGPGDQHLHLTGSATFLHLPRLATELDRVPDDRPLRVHIDRLDHIDHACLELLSSWNRRRSNEGKPGMVVEWDELTERYRRALVGAHNRSSASSRSLLSTMWAEWKRTHAPRYRFTPTEPQPREDWLDASRIRVGLNARSLNDVLTAAAELLAPAVDRSSDEIAAALVGRAQGHVTLGHGVSIPHSPMPGLSRSVAALVVTTHPIDVSGEAADVFFVLLAPDDNPELHLRSLANVGRLCIDGALVGRLRQASSAADAASLVENVQGGRLGGERPPRAEILAIVEVGSDAQRQRAQRLISDAYPPLPPLATTSDPLAHALRTVLGSAPDRQLLWLVVSNEDVSVLSALVAEQSRAKPHEPWKLHVLRPEQVATEFALSLAAD